MKRLLSVFAFLFAFCSSSSAVAERMSASGRPSRLIDDDGTVALKGATVIDGTGARPLHAAMVVLVKDRIVYVGDAAGVRLGSRAKVVNLAGRWVVPGFIDAHGHLPNADGAAGFLTQLLAFGTTTLRAPFGPRVELRDAVAGGSQLGPMLFVSGNLIDGTESFSGVATRVATEAEVRDVVRRTGGSEGRLRQALRRPATELRRRSPSRRRTGAGCE